MMKKLVWYTLKKISYYSLINLFSSLKDNFVYKSYKLYLIFHENSMTNKNFKCGLALLLFVANEFSRIMI